MLVTLRTLRVNWFEVTCSLMEFEYGLIGLANMHGELNGKGRR